jgi:hypothetical protein
MFDSIQKALTYLKQALQGWGTTKRTLENRLIEISTMIGNLKREPTLNQEAAGRLIVLKTQTV